MSNQKFPAASYKKAVLEPIFADFKKHFYQELMQINYAHTIMLTEEKVIKQSEAEEIIRGLKEIQNNLNLEELAYTGEYEDLFFYIESALTKKVGADIAGKMHTGRSRNDMDLTMYKMKLKDKILQLMENLLSLIEKMLVKANENLETIVVAYTHGQPAQPTTFAHYLGALIEILLRDYERLSQSYSFADHSSMGAAAITTSGFCLNRKRMAELLGFANVQENSYGAIAAVDYLNDIYSSLKIMLVNIGRFVQDLIYLTGYDANHLKLGKAFVQISSIMPQKRNPVALEHLRVMSSLASGYCDNVINTTHNTPFTDMNDSEDATQVVGFQAFSYAEKVLALLEDVISDIEINEEKQIEDILKSYVSITELADTLVRKESISFRQAHEITSQLVEKMNPIGKKINELNVDDFRELFKDVIGREPDLLDEEIKECVTPEHFIEVRKMTGGPAPVEMKKSILGYRSKYSKYLKRTISLQEKRDAVRLNLNKEVEAFLI